jgi:hypothetical protein
LKADDKDALWQRILSDYAYQLSYLEGLQGALGNAYKDPREYKGYRGKDTGGRHVTKKSAKQKDVPKNVHTIPYLMWAYEVSKCIFKRRLKQQKMGLPLCEASLTKYIGLSVIECRELARERYNPKFFYSHEKAMLSRDPTSDDQCVPEWKKYKYRVGYFGKIFDNAVSIGEDMSHYDARPQPYIKDDIMDAL